MTDLLYPLSGKKVWVAGHRGMVGSALLRRLAREDCEVITAERAALDLTRQAAVESWMADNRPQLVVLAAAKVGGILANDSAPGPFLHDNLAIQTNVIHAAWTCGVEKLVFLGSSCIYPKAAPQPIREDYLLTSALEPTNTRTPEISSSAIGPRRIRDPNHMGPVAVKRPSPRASTLYSAE